MSVESDIYTALQSLVSGRLYPDIGPQDATLPYMTYQQVGGDPANFLAGIPSKRNGRFQINAWARTRAESATLIRSAEDLMRTTSTLNATTLGGAIAVFEPDTKLFGSSQDFSVWF
jgi:hypothetical protein